MPSHYALYLSTRQAWCVCMTCILNICDALFFFDLLLFAVIIIIVTVIFIVVVIIVVIIIIVVVVVFGQPSCTYIVFFLFVLLVCQ